MTDKFNYFNALQDSIRALASKADAIIFPSKLKKEERDDLLEDCLIVACFYMSTFHSQPPFLIDFINHGIPADPSKDKKGTGSFYTPIYIAEYIVQQTIGPLIEKIKKENLSVSDKITKICDLKVCDPACGGSIFLVCAMDFVIEQCLRISSYAFAMEELSKMALGTVFGVDINQDAIEFSKMILNTNKAKWALLDQINHFQQFGEAALPS